MSAAVWTEPYDPHQRLGAVRVQAEPPEHARRITVLATDLRPGDQIRDRGMLRTISSIEGDPRLRDTVDVRFERIAGKPDGLGIVSTVTVTAWRPADDV